MKLKPLKYGELIARLKKLGLVGPFQGSKHPYFLKGNLSILIPNQHRGDYLGYAKELSCCINSGYRGWACLRPGIIQQSRYQQWFSRAGLTPVFHFARMTVIKYMMKYYNNFITKSGWRLWLSFMPKNVPLSGIFVTNLAVVGFLPSGRNPTGANGRYW